MLTRYRELVPQLRLAGCNHNLFTFFIVLIQSCMQQLMIFLPFSVTGPTSFAPVIEMAITIVEQNHGQYHVLVIIADGQVWISALIYVV